MISCQETSEVETLVLARRKWIGAGLHVAGVVKELLGDQSLDLAEVVDVLREEVEVGGSWRGLVMVLIHWEEAAEMILCLKGEIQETPTAGVEIQEILVQEVVDRLF